MFNYFRRFDEYGGVAQLEKLCESFEEVAGTMLEIPSPDGVQQAPEMHAMLDEVNQENIAIDLYEPFLNTAVSDLRVNGALSQDTLDEFNRLVQLDVATIEEGNNSLQKTYHRQFVGEVRGVMNSPLYKNSY